MNRKQIHRVKQMKVIIDETEARYQKAYGDRLKGSIRSSHVMDSKALGALIEFVENALKEAQ